VEGLLIRCWISFLRNGGMLRPELGTAGGIRWMRSFGGRYRGWSRRTCERFASPPRAALQAVARIESDPLLNLEPIQPLLEILRQLPGFEPLTAG